MNAAWFLVQFIRISLPDTTGYVIIIRYGGIVRKNVV